ncbi:MAG: hypothetical protein JNJ77_01760 [Planctomycetia bacterium]|nr:hypothetical protein [Planctomycetia bacterium]
MSVTLTNTSLIGCSVPADILTGVFFDVSGNTALTQISAIIANGSFRVNTNGNAPVAGNVGGEWDYARANSGTLSGVSQKQGISSSGLGIFADGSFNGPELDGPPNGAVDGMQYGLLSAGGRALNANAALFSNDFVQNSVVFTLSGIANLNDNTNLAALFSNIRFQYGTDLSEPSFGGNPDGGPNPVPVPAGVLLMGLGGICLAGYKVRRNRKVAKLA